MKKQPAKINYFFKGGYVELWRTICATFAALGGDIVDAWEILADGWCDFWGSFFSAVSSMFELEFEWDEIWDSIKGVCKFSYGLGKLFFILIITTGLCVFFSLAHTVVLLAIMIIAYTFFMLLSLFDAIYRGVNHISNNCPSCQDHFALPVYICPDCGVEHTQLWPSKYGIWKRTCECGCKLPTTFLNGRGKLESRCPSCGVDIKDGGNHMDISIPVVGGASSGKTCFINQAITTIGKVAESYGLDFEYSPTGLDDYENNMSSMENGNLPDKTNDMRLMYYRFYLNSKTSKIKNLVSLCDVGGEVYGDSESLGAQVGYKHANAFLMVIDPLSVTMFREELKKKGVDPTSYGYSNDSVDEIIGMLISTLENMFCQNAKAMLKKDVVVVFSKCDVPGLSELIGDVAVAKYMQENPTLTKYEAQNAVCEQFLRDYEEINFLNAMKSKFRTIQFFCASSLGHNVDGTPFEAKGVEDPVLWLVDKISPTIDLQSKWGKKL